MVKGVIGEKKLKVGDTAILYVTTCSDVDANLRYSRRLLECLVIGKIKGFTRDKDDRYIIRCSEDLREECIKNGVYADEAIVSKYSPFLMTHEEYAKYQGNPALLSRWISEVTSLLLGYEVPRHLKNWQDEVVAIMDGLGLKPDSAVTDIMDDFRPGNGLALVSFPH